MSPRISLFTMSGLPEAFGYAVLAFCFILCLSPYFAGQDFGVFKFPPFEPRAKRLLRLFGPILLLVSVLAFLPLFATAAKAGAIPEVQGEWRRTAAPSDGLLIDIKQDGPHLSFAFTSAGAQESAAGKYFQSEGFFDLTIEHSGSNCTQSLFGRLYPLSAIQFKMQLYAASGDCAPMLGPGDFQYWSRP